jgi:hypothetical protein
VRSQKQKSIFSFLPDFQLVDEHLQVIGADSFAACKFFEKLIRVRNAAAAGGHLSANHGLNCLT